MPIIKRGEKKLFPIIERQTPILDKIRGGATEDDKAPPLERMRKRFGIPKKE